MTNVFHIIEIRSHGLDIKTEYTHRNDPANAKPKAQSTALFCRDALAIHRDGGHATSSRLIVVLL